jgi:hypothetical protein
MLKELFDQENHTPLQKLMVAVNRGSSSVATKKQLTKNKLLESLDDSIVKIDNERILKEHFEYACSYMADDIHQCNKVKGTNIADKFITGMEQRARDSTSINSSISSMLIKLQGLRFGCFPPAMSK